MNICKFAQFYQNIGKCKNIFCNEFAFFLSLTKFVVEKIQNDFEREIAIVRDSDVFEI